MTSSMPTQEPHACQITRSTLTYAAQTSRSKPRIPVRSIGSPAPNFSNCCRVPKSSNSKFLQATICAAAPSDVAQRAEPTSSKLLAFAAFASALLPALAGSSALHRHFALEDLDAFDHADSLCKVTQQQHYRSCKLCIFYQKDSSWCQ